jgi:membrane-associated protease RseP (regulator of RpoE activity)
LIATSIGAIPRATVRVLASEVQGSFGLGEAIPGVGTVDRIGFRSIDVVDGAGRRATLSLLDQTAASRSKGAAIAPGDRRGPRRSIRGRIKKIDDHTFEVERSLVREMVGGGGTGGMRAIPMMENGEIAGLRITMARPGSAAAAIGVKPGDRFTSINNDPIKSAQQMLDLFAKLDSLNVVEIQGTRANKPLAITLRLR